MQVHPYDASQGWPEVQGLSAGGPPARSGLRRALLWLGVVVVLAAEAVGGYVTNAGSRSYPKAWDARVLDIVHFVEQERGLTFKHAVAVSFLGDKAFVEKVKDPAPTAAERKDLTLGLEEWRALGLVSGHPDLFKAHNDLVSADVVGLYVPKEKTLYVRGTDLTPYVRTTVAHELTHALQDQYFDIQAIQDKAPDSSVVRTLIEGDAVRVQQAYEEQLSHADQADFGRTERRLQSSSHDATTNVPPILQDIETAPYLFGPTLLDTLVADGGNASVDAAFRHPPVTDAQIVDPRAYPLSFKPRHLPDPALPAGATGLDHADVFGQLGVFEVLGTQLGYDASWAAVQGWAGDTNRPYRLAGRTCVALDVGMSDDDAAAHLAAAFHAWQKGRPGASVTTNDRTVEVRACDRGDTKSSAVAQPRAFEVLSDRAQAIHLVMTQGHVGFDTARCGTDTFLQRVGTHEFVQFLASADPPPEAIAEFRQSFQSC